MRYKSPFIYNNSFRVQSSSSHSSTVKMNTMKSSLFAFAILYTSVSGSYFDILQCFSRFFFFQINHFFFIGTSVCPKLWMWLTIAFASSVAFASSIANRLRMWFTCTNFIFATCANRFFATCANLIFATCTNLMFATCT